MDQDNEIRELTIEQSFTALDQIIEQMQSEDISLEDMFRLYKKGIELVDGCNSKIEKIQCEIQKINTEA